MAKQNHFLFFGRYLHDVEIAIEAIKSNALKSMLTALGIIFGVAAVISMLAIGNGAQKEILEQMKMVGANNIVINPVLEKASAEAATSGPAVSKRWNIGLTLADARAIRNVVPTVKRISPQVVHQGHFQHDDKRIPGTAIGVNSDYFDIYNLPLAEGTYFSSTQLTYGRPVCVIGSEVRAQLFGKVEPLGSYLKFGSTWYEVVGVLARTESASSGTEALGVNAYNASIYLPITTVLLRYSQRGSGTFTLGKELPASADGNTGLDRIIVQVNEPEQVLMTQEIIQRLMRRLHSEVENFAVIVPEQLLKQQQRTKDIFNWVLGAIAGISLLVGGIGIMNIMFASVMERIKEIGTRLAIGARKADIVAQFLSESVLISVSGGLIGVLLGVLLSYLIRQIAQIETLVSLSSIILAFGVSAAVGVIFGFAPARRAAQRSPIESLRYE